MTRLLLTFILCLQMTNFVGAQKNLTDSTIQLDSAYISKVVLLINDFKACAEYSKELENRLVTAKEIIDRTTIERDEYKYILDNLNEALKESNERKEKLQRKLKRTRKIGVIGTITGLIVGVLAVLII